MVEIIPAILEQEAEKIAEKLKRVEGLVERVQMDVMDGRFVPNETFHDPEKLKEIPGTVKIEVHLMVEEPAKAARKWKKDPRVDRVLFHVEAVKDVKKTIAELKKLGLEVGLVINPETKPEMIERFMGEIDAVLVMGVNPGFSGQAIQPETVEKIRTIHTFDPSLPIEVDGGVTLENIGELTKAGATRIAAAYAIFSKSNTKKAIEALRNAVKK